MLKKFFLNVLSSFMGAWLAIVTLGLVALVLIFGLIGKALVNTENTMQLKSGSMLVIDLSGIMEERPDFQTPDLIELLSNSNAEIKSLETHVKAIQRATESPDIDAILLECNGMAASPATVHALYKALEDFHKSGKKIYAYSNQMMQGDYMLASIADKVYINPQGALCLEGFGGYTPYFKSLLDKIGVEMQVVKVGSFKSAVEPFILDEMSQPARAQLDTLYNELWSQYKDIIAKARNVKPSLIDTLINRDYILARTPELALKSKLIDGICYQHEMEELIAKDLSVKKFNDINLVDVDCMYNDYLSHESKKGSEVAVIYACGEIDGAPSGGIQSNELVPLIFELKDNDDVCALVLRVNSPGGSAFGSEQIWEALQQFKASGKPFVVSMGDYAASGGYYISCGADKIFADPMTITGSIGIFGLIPNVDNLLSDKLGVNVQMVSTNPAGQFPTIVKPMTPEQTAAMQSMVEQGYETFVSRVAEGRNMKPEQVKLIGEGRVWDAVKAKEIGLIDDFGSLDTAIAQAARLANSENEYHISVYPEIQMTFWTMLNQMSRDSQSVILNTVDKESLLIMQAKQIMQRKPIQDKMQDMILRM